VYPTCLRRIPIAFVRRGAALAALTIATAGAGVAPTAAAAGADTGPSVRTDSGLVRGDSVAGGYAFRGLPYAAAPTRKLRWRSPRAAREWKGVRDATQFAPSCPQPARDNPFLPPGPLDEDCLYLNISTPTLRDDDGGRPVLVWIHGGGLTQDAARNYDGSKLAAEGTVVVTINYRLGALGFLAHPALASRPNGSAGNYGLMDQRAALRWVKRNIARFGGDPDNVTIAGQSAGGLSVLAHLVSRGSRGLFHRAIVQSGAFALKQQSLADAKAEGEAFAARAGCRHQNAGCLRRLPVSDLVASFQGAAIPGVVDGAVLKKSIGTALAGGRFARVPILNGVNQDEQLIFLGGLGAAVSGGRFVPLPESVTAESYQRVIAAVLGVPAARAAAIATEYPLDAYPVPFAAFSTLVSDANFACPALRLDRWTSKRVPTFAYQFNDDAAPHRFAPPGALPPIATHSAELQYLFDLPNAPAPGTLNAEQEALAAGMRAAWAGFAAHGNPTSAALTWPPFGGAGPEHVLSLVPPQPQAEPDFASTHHCGFWRAG
jgi:para-nitrobenzyl esterase